MFIKIIHKAVIACMVLFSICAYAGTETFVYDGKYVEAQYDKSFSIDYTDEAGNPVLGGTLAFANVGNKQYIYIAHPLGFKDLSYAAEESECGGGSRGVACKENDVPDSDVYKVGWDNKKHQNAEVAVHSEHFTLSLGGEQMKFDLGVPGEENQGLHITDNKIEGVNVEDGNFFTADDGTEISFLSTLNYNSAQVNSGNYYADLGEFYFHSPQTVSCDVDNLGNVDLNNETSSDPSCYALDTSIDKNYLDGDAGNGNNDLIDWQFQFGIEIELSKKLYTELLANMDASIFGVDDNSAVISLDGLHASPPKANNCDDPTDGCTVTVTEKPPIDVPEPSTIAILALALGLLRVQSKRRNT